MNLHKNKAAALTAAAVIAASVSAYGTVVDNIDGKGVTISGHTEEANAPIAIEVYVKGKTALDLKDLTEAERLALLVSYDGGKTDENGDYSFTFDIPQGTGEYTAYAATEKTALEKEDFVFVANADFQAAAEDLNNASDKDAVEELLKDKPYELGLSQAEVDNISVSDLAAILYNQKTTQHFDITDRAGTQKTVRTAYFVQQLNEGKVADILDADLSVTDLDKSDIKDWYNKKYITSKLKSDFTNRMSKQSYKSINQYMDDLAENFVLATVRHPNGNGNVEDVVEAFASEIGVSGITVKNDVWAKIAGKDFASYGELADEIKRLNKSTGGGGSPGGSTGGSTGGSYSSLRDSAISGQEKSEPEKLPADIYTDIDDYEWAKNAIVALSEQNIISGDGNGNFRPGDNIKREEFCKLVVKAFGLTATENKTDFSDVDDKEWYAEYVNIAAQNGVVNGDGNGSFGVGQNITREDMAVMLYRAYTLGESADKAETDFVFGDDTSISDYAKDAVYSLKDKGVINGVDESNFAPKNLAQRAEAAKMIYALIRK